MENILILHTDQNPHMGNLKLAGSVQKIADASLVIVYSADFGYGRVIKDRHGIFEVQADARVKVEFVGEAARRTPRPAVSPEKIAGALTNAGLIQRGEEFGKALSLIDDLTIQALDAVYVERPSEDGEQRQYPYGEGDVAVLGPEVFASADGNVISWQGENYVRQTSGGRLLDKLEEGSDGA